MAEELEGSHFVRVRAQVMKRDDDNDGWVVHGGGGMADVVVCRRPATADRNLDDTVTEGYSTTTPPMEYFIHGNRVSDNAVMLECTIKKDFEYSKVMPTFHHWVTDEKRFGLTFQTAADARAFDKSVRTAIEQLLQGCPTLEGWRADTDLPREEADEDTIFECVDLPFEPKSSPEYSSAMNCMPDDAEGASAAPANRPRTDMEEEALARTMLFAQLADDDLPVFGSDSGSSSNGITAAGDSQLSSSSAPVHRPVTQRDDQNQGGRFVTKNAGHTPPMAAEQRVEKRVRNQCKRCHEWYLERDNRPGACEAGPNCLRSCVERASCMEAARCMTYHCLSDSEGDMPPHPCNCMPVGRTCFKRWLALAVLSLIVPCLCLYPPLNCMNMCTTRCGITGAAHVPMFNTDPPGERNPWRQDM